MTQDEIYTQAMKILEHADIQITSMLMNSTPEIVESFRDSFLAEKMNLDIDWIIAGIDTNS